jgi:hypothetical protein
MKRWPTKPLEEIAELFGGSTPSRGNPAFWNGDIPWVTPTDLPMPDEGISIVSHTKHCITQVGLDGSSATVVPEGTVLFSSRATIGKVAVANKPVITNQGFEHFDSLRKHECLPSDVLVGTLGNPNLRACVLPEEIPQALNKADCVRIRPHPRVALAHSSAGS